MFVTVVLNKSDGLKVYKLEVNNWEGYIRNRATCYAIFVILIMKHSTIFF